MPPSTTGPGRLLSRVRAWTDASTSELVGLAILLAGALVVTLLLWLRAPVRSAGTVVADPRERGVPLAAPTGAASIIVHVTGAVRQPGLVELEEGSRVSDAVAGAGGFTLGADPSGLNLARPVGDGEQLAVPHVGEPSGDLEGEPAGSSSAMRSDGRVDLNLATAADLEELPGIGPVLAERIVAWREEHGPFTDAGQLREVPGIGERTFQNLVDLVAV